MGQRQDYFKDLVLKKFPSGFKHPKLSFKELQDSNYLKNVEEVYKNLEGQYTPLPLIHGAWDISTTNFIIELDEERHFNRYRLKTLTSSFYNDYHLFSIIEYKRYCLNLEKECLIAAKFGGYWKNNSTEKMFIKSDEAGKLEKNGSSRWRQRAYYDFIKDVTSKIRNFPIIRISIYDNFEGNLIGDLLRRKEDKILNEFIDKITESFR